MLEFVEEKKDKINFLKIKSWPFSHGFIDNSLDFKAKNQESAKEWASFSKTKLKLINQVHGIQIAGLNQENSDADGWLVKLEDLSSQNLSVGIKTADCSPVIVYGKSRQTVALLHCGWRSAYGGILRNSINALVELGEKTSEIDIAIGPAAQGDSYEVGVDLVEKFANTNSIKEVDNKYYLSIADYLRFQAKELNVESVIASSACTIKNENYFSFRRQKENSGRQLSFIG